MANKQLLHEDFSARRYFNDMTLRERVGVVMHRAKMETPMYLKSFFPIVGWIGGYNWRWMVGDFVAGVTVGTMVVPQSLAYAKLANLPLPYGLYSAFMGVMLYALMGTSREISVGPTAVLSLLVGGTVSRVSQEGFSAHDVAVGICFYSSLISLFLGVFRLGFLLDLIPNPVITGFTTGAAFTIMLTQLASLLGIPNVSSNAPTYRVIYNMAKNILSLSLNDLAFGMSSLAFIKLAELVSRKTNKRFIKIGSNATAVLLFTVVSFAISKASPDFKLKIVGQVKAKFTYIGVPNLSTGLFGKLAPDLPAVTLITVLEHVALCKAFARNSGYQVSSSQELFALGTCNFAASFFSAFPATGSFSRSAVKSQSGVCTPIAGVWTGVVVLLALWFLTEAFYYIPSATLAAVIMSSASTLVTSPKSIVELAKVHPGDATVFLVGAIVTFFFGAELGIALSVAVAFVKLVYRLAHPTMLQLYQTQDGTFIDSKHPLITKHPPPPGVIVFRPQQSLIFPNIDFIRDNLIDLVSELTRSGAAQLPRDARLWSDDMAGRGERLRAHRAKLENTPAPDEAHLPFLRAIILDLSAVSIIDSSGMQGIIDLRNSFARYAGCPTPAEHHSHFSSDMLITNPPEANKRTPSFEFHFVTTDPAIASLLIKAKVTRHLEPTEIIIHTAPTILPIQDPYIHLTIADAISSLQSQ
ncbi:Sulfate permease 2 [Entomophthora muscae]|uniref:Sulfate permease 2 n=1 Tax=Entomophthora muscae TaxID=34485 RepID=A0ACC2RQZ9_9FUNG|nr:Sulfate permease 2 [Entomophthora muscae]